eukprot:jgi/Antlo1/1416/1383
MQNNYSESLQDYCIIKEIGRGKMGTVYTAVHEPTKELLTIKKIDTAKMSLAEVDALEKEAKDVNGLKSKIVLPSIVVFRDENALYVVKELMDLGSIGNCLQGCREFFTEDNIKVVLYKILVGLKALHNEGRIHRNLNSGNILLDTSGKIKFTNPATHPAILDDIREINPEKFHDLSSIFIAPEVSEDNAAITKAMDIWSVGIIAIEMIYGDFTKLSKESVLEVDGLINFRRFVDREEKFYDTYGWIPQNLLDFLKRCLITSPEHRITVAECLNLPLFVNLKNDKYSQFLKENTEIQRLRKSILDLNKAKPSTCSAAVSTQQKDPQQFSGEAERLVDEKYSNREKEVMVFTTSPVESNITRTKTGRFVLAEISTNEGGRLHGSDISAEDNNGRALISRRFTSDLSKVETAGYNIFKLQKYKTHRNEYRRGRFWVFEGEIGDLVPSGDILALEIEYLSKLKNLHSRQIDLLQGIFECDSVTERGIKYCLYREFHELRVLLDQLRLGGSPTLIEQCKVGK